MDEKIYNKIIKKKEFSRLIKKDVEMAFSIVLKKGMGEEEVVKKTRALLHKVYGAFGSRKLFQSDGRNAEWVLRKHLSTRERFDYYCELYGKLLKNFKGCVVDFGAGVNGFSFGFFPNKKISYLGIEAVGQLVDLMNNSFKGKNLKAKALHLSLFNLEKIKKEIKKIKSKKVIFLFKVLDGLEMLERDFSKKFLGEIVPLAERVVVSFATRSMVSRKKFKANRNWIVNFIKENFKMEDDFELGSERYLVFRK